MMSGFFNYLQVFSTLAERLANCRYRDFLNPIIFTAVHAKLNTEMRFGLNRVVGIVEI